MSRRRVLALLGATAAAGAATVGSVLPASARTSDDRGTRRIAVEQISIQLFTLRLITLVDPEPALARLAEIGYLNVELSGTYGRSAVAFRRVLDRNGLRATSSHIDPSGDVEQKAEDAVALGQKYANLGSRQSLRTEREWATLAQQVNLAAAAFAKAGVRYGYHNHDTEFRPLSDNPRLTGYQVLTRELDPRLVHRELDVYWADVAGVDPLQLFREQPHRFLQLHMKDRGAIGTADLGTGTIDFKRILAANPESGAQEFIVEQDNSLDPLRTARVGFEYLRDIQF